MSSKTLKTFVAGAFFLIALCILPCHAADVAKIGVFDQQKFINESEIGKQANAKLEAAGQKMQADLESLGAEIEELRKSLEKDAMVIKQEMIEEKQRALSIKTMDFDQMKKKYYRDTQEMQRALILDLNKKLSKLVNDFGSKEGYLLILEKQAAIYYPSAIDITDKLIEAANAQKLSLDQ